MKLPLSLLIIVSLLIGFSSQAQEEGTEEYVMYEMTAEDLAYREFRNRKTVPPYGLEKVQKMVAKIKSQENANEYELLAISNDDYNSLSTKEKYTYVMIHLESYAQNCDIIIPQPNEDKKIFGHLISWGDEYAWSERQIKFLKNNKTEVMKLIKESTIRSKHMGVNYKEAIITMNAWEMIPFLIKYYKSNNKDKDALTVLLQLMWKGKYMPFIESQSYKKLYAPEYNYETYLDFNNANEVLIINRAQKYYQQKK